MSDAYLKYEDQTRLKASIVLDYYEKEVSAIPDDSLNFTDKERKEQVLTLIRNLSHLKIIDAPVLFRLYDLYRIKF